MTQQNSDTPLAHFGLLGDLLVCLAGNGTLVLGDMLLILD